MKFGVRQIANVVFRATQDMTLGNQNVVKGQPVFYLDTAKTSTIEGAATTVYAQGGRGNTRLIAWQGEKTLTFTVEDALLSPISFAMLSGAGLVKGNSNQLIHFHQTSSLVASSLDASIDLENALEPEEEIDLNAPLFILMTDNSGDLTGEMISAGYQFETTTEGGISTTNYKKLILKDFDPDQEKSMIPVIYNPEGADSDKNTKQQWESVIVRKTFTGTTVDENNINEAQDWRYAEPLIAGKQITLLKGAANLSSYTFPETEVNQGEYSYDSNSDSSASISDIINKFHGISKGLYRLDSSLSVVPYNISNLNITIGSLASQKETGEDFYRLPEADISFDATNTNQPNFKETGDAILSTVTNINSVLNKNTLKVVNKYIKYGATSLDDTNITNKESDILKNFVKVQKALQYYYFSTHYKKDLPTPAATYGFEKANVADSTNTDVSVWYATFIKNKTDYDNGVAFYKTAGKTVMVDYYVTKAADTVSELQIDASNFAGYYYVEADTLFRRQIDGKDLPANITFPNVKIQSNFTFSMAPTGDPSEQMRLAA